jgi:hypothetical protein
MPRNGNINVIDFPFLREVDQYILPPVVESDVSRKIIWKGYERRRVFESGGYKKSPDDAAG